MLSPSQAVKNALSTTRNIVGRCDEWVARYYGYSSSGYATAASHWAAIPTSEKHPGDANPPAGALVFWGGGAGHVAISTGNGNVVSTDYPRSGITSETSISSISNGWGKSYLGWSVPVFQGQVSNASYQVNPAGGILGGSVGSTLLDYLTGKFGTDIKDMAERFALMFLGGILILLGILNITNKKLSVLLTGPQEAKKTAKDTANKEVTEVENGSETA